MSNEFLSVITAPTQEELQRLLCLKKPMIIEGAMDSWPAMDKWSDTTYFKAVVEETATVQVIHILPA